MVTKIDFMFFDAGGGHRSAATALKSVIDQRNLPWDVRLVNLQEILDSLDVFRKVTGLRLEDLYNKMLAKGWTLGAAQWLKLVHGGPPPQPPAHCADAATALGADPAGHGRFAGPELQPGALSRLASGFTRHAFHYYSNRFRRLPSAFLDRTLPRQGSRAVPGLRNRASRRASRRSSATLPIACFPSPA